MGTPTCCKADVKDASGAGEPVDLVWSFEMVLFKTIGLLLKPTGRATVRLYVDAVAMHEAVLASLDLAEEEIGFGRAVLDRVGMPSRAVWLKASTRFSALAAGGGAARPRDAKAHAAAKAAVTTYVATVSRLLIHVPQLRGVGLYFLGCFPMGLAQAIGKCASAWTGQEYYDDAAEHGVSVAKPSACMVVQGLVAKTKDAIRRAADDEEYRLSDGARGDSPPIVLPALGMEEDEEGCGEESESSDVEIMEAL